MANYKFISGHKIESSLPDIKYPTEYLKTKNHMQTNTIKAENIN
jgi:hypothetical protein